MGTKGLNANNVYTLPILSYLYLFILPNSNETAGRVILGRAKELGFVVSMQLIAAVGTLRWWYSQCRDTCIPYLMSNQKQSRPNFCDQRK